MECIMNNKILTLLCSISFILTGCSSNNSATKPLADLKTGVLLDSAVSNIRYRTTSQDSFTDTDGKFSYIDGETVIFSIGNTVFPEVKAEGVITPMVLAGNSALNNQQVINIAILLQSLDQDGDPSNGIVIPEGAAAATEAIVFNVPVETFRTNKDVEDMVKKSGSTRGVINAAAAKQHLKETIENETPYIGSWTVRNGEFSEQHLILFADNTFVYAYYDANGDANGDVKTKQVNSAGESTSADPAISGLELGSYSYDMASKNLTLSITDDDNGNYGLGEIDQNIVFKTELSEPEQQTRSTAAGPEPAIASKPVRLTIYNDDFKDLVLTANKLSGTTLVGAWTPTNEKVTTTDTTETDTATELLVLFQSAYFIAVNIRDNAGVEFGTYATAQEDKLEFTVINNNNASGVKEFGSPGSPGTTNTAEFDLIISTGPTLTTKFYFDRSL
jgi:hypothetical protein